jgi:flagellar hook-length control protein FliK
VQEPLPDVLALGAPAIVAPAAAAPHAEPRKEDENRRESPDSTPHPTPAAARFGDPPPVREFGAVRVEHEAPQEMLSPAGMDRILGGARVSVSQGGMEVRLRLHPESLGEVRVQVRWEGGMLSARLQADSPAARDALQAAAPGLHAALREQGIPVEHLSIGLRMDLEARSQRQQFESQDAQRPDRPSAGTGPAPDPVAEDERAPAGRLDVRI